MKRKIIIVAGDPNSINTEIISKTWKKINDSLKRKIYLIGDFNLICNQFEIINNIIPVIKVKNIDEEPKSKKLKIIHIPCNFKDPFRVSFSSSRNYLIKSLDLAHRLAQKKTVLGLINCPLNKNLLSKSRKIGVTEYLASKCKIINDSEVMLIYNKRFSVLPITTHIHLKNVPKKISKRLIIKKLITLKKNYRKFVKKAPKIGILGLNPHNAEFDRNSEEKKVIIPAISKLKQIGFKIQGPLPADTTFISNYKNYDVLVGMYHDQVLTPFKSIFNFDAINITLGLKYLRVSPDHGPAIDLIKKKKANYLSLYRCIQFINNTN